MFNAQIAQKNFIERWGWPERSVANRRVVGSNPTLGSFRESSSKLEPGSSRRLVVQVHPLAPFYKKGHYA